MEYKNLIIEAIIEFPEFAEEYKDEYNVIIGNAESALTMPINLYEFHLQIYEQLCKMILFRVYINFMKTLFAITL